MLPVPPGLQDRMLCLDIDVADSVKFRDSLTAQGCFLGDQEKWLQEMATQGQQLSANILLSLLLEKLFLGLQLPVRKAMSQYPHMNILSCCFGKCLIMLQRKRRSVSFDVSPAGPPASG